MVFGATGPGCWLDCFTVSLHSNNIHLLRGLSVAFEKLGEIPTSWSCGPRTRCDRSIPQSIFRPANHKGAIPANWRPCVIPHWLSYNHNLWLCSRLPAGGFTHRAERRMGVYSRMSSVTKQLTLRWCNAPQWPKILMESAVSSADGIIQGTGSV